MGTWSALVPELLDDILRRVDAGAERWPQRRDLVVFASVCHRWREAAVALVRPPLRCGGITFLSSLKQVRPHRILTVYHLHCLDWSCVVSQRLFRF